MRHIEHDFVSRQRCHPISQLTPILRLGVIRALWVRDLFFCRQLKRTSRIQASSINDVLLVLLLTGVGQLRPDQQLSQTLTTSVRAKFCIQLDRQASDVEIFKSVPRIGRF